MHAPTISWTAFLILSAQGVLSTGFSPNPAISGLGAGPKPAKDTRSLPYLQRRQYFPSANYNLDYCRFFDFQSTKLGDKIWIEGGAFTDKSSKIYSNPGYLSIDFSQKFSLPIKSSSSNVDTSITYPSDFPFTWLGALYSDGKSKLYQYGGYFPDYYSYPLPQVALQSNTLYELDTDTKTFRRQDVSSTSRASNGGYINVPEIGLGFWMGGFISNITDSLFRTWKWPTEFMVLDSLLTIDTGAGTIANTSRTDGVFNPTSAGSFVHLPSGNGGKGYLVTIGGYVGPPGIMSTSATTGDYKLAPLDTIYIYDIDKDKWHSQSTSGNTPTPRQLTCAVLATAKDNSSFNIVLHAGANWGGTEGYADIWVLSLPSFQWIKIDDSASSSTVRMTHRCHLMSDNQMVVIGGRGIDQYTYLLYGASWKNIKMGACDPGGFVNILDLNTFKWRQDFDPDYKGYVVHDRIVEVIGGNGNGSATQLSPVGGWNDPQLGSIFNSIMHPSSKKTAAASVTPIGAIVGGAVGGIALLSALAGLVFYLHRKKTQTPPPQQQPPIASPPVGQTQPQYFAPLPGQPHPQGGYYQPAYPGSPVQGSQFGTVGQPYDEKTRYSTQQPSPGYPPGYPQYGQPAYPQSPPPPADVHEVYGSTQYQPQPQAQQSPYMQPATQFGQMQQPPTHYSELPGTGSNNK